MFCSRQKKSPPLCISCLVVSIDFRDVVSVENVFNEIMSTMVLIDNRFAGEINASVDSAVFSA